MRQRCRDRKTTTISSSVRLLPDIRRPTTLSRSLTFYDTTIRTFMNLSGAERLFSDFSIGKSGETERLKQLTNSTTQRKSPISASGDHNQSAQTENEPFSDWLLFSRNASLPAVIVPEDRTAVPSVTTNHLEAAQWLFTREALQLYSDTFNTTTFNNLDGIDDFKSSFYHARRTADEQAAKKPLKLCIELKDINCCLSLSTKSTLEQMEPFFVRLFLFDVVNCVRLTEEFHTTFVPKHLQKMFTEGLAVGSNPLGTEALIDSTVKVNEIPYNILMHPEARKAFCVLASSRDVFVVVRVERLLSDSSADVYGKVLDGKQVVKIQKTAQLTCQKLAKYRSLFAWTACPLSPSNLKPGFTSPANRGWPLFRCEGRLTDQDLQRYLIDCSKSEKSGKLISIPNATITITVQEVPSFFPISCRISPSLLPLKPWKPNETGPPTIPVFELQSFGDVVTQPFHELINLLYVYPISLSYGGQTAFNRARNISCSVRYVGSSRRDCSRVKAVMDRSSCCGPFLVSANTAIQYHEQNPTFNDEIKIQLPVVVDSTDHLLFSFTHVSVSNALTPKSEKETVETPVGFAWLPLTRSDNYLILSDDVQDFDLSVASTLTAGYIHYQGPQQGKNSEIKWLDNGRPLFRVRLRLVSSVFTTEDNLQAFFQACQKLYDFRSTKVNGKVVSRKKHRCSTSEYSYVATGSPGNKWTTEEKLFEKIATKAKMLFQVETTRLIPHFPVVLRRLFALLPICTSEEVAMKLLSVTIGIVDNAESAGFQNVLHSFIKFHFALTTEDDETSHSAICHYLAQLLHDIRDEQQAISRIFRQLWFFLDVIIRSMARWLIATRRFKVTRQERFSVGFMCRIENLVEVIVRLIVSNYDLSEVIFATAALANFLRSCMSLADRCTVLNQINLVLETMDRKHSSDAAVTRIRNLKYCFLQIFCSHDLAEAAENPIRLAELHVQLADSYRGSARLRCTWFETLAQMHIREKLYSEAAVCQAHSVAIVAKELLAQNAIKVDWTLFDAINDCIPAEERVFALERTAHQHSRFTLDSLTSIVETTVQTLILAERFEAVGPLCRLVIPIYEKLNDYKSLMSIYADLQEASSRAAEILTSGRRSFGSYFRVVFYSKIFFGEEDRSEWIYREPGLTSLAEACDRMVTIAQRVLGTEHVQVLPENKINLDALQVDVAYIQMTHVEPYTEPTSDETLKSINIEASRSQNNSTAYYLHTNVRCFSSEERLIDETVSTDAPEQAKLCLRRTYFFVDDPFPNTCRRQKIVSRRSIVLNPLELACDSLRQKAFQIRRFLSAAGIPPFCARGGIDSTALVKLDLKGLQCSLQGAVSPTVNAGVLAYAEAFTLPPQLERYGYEGVQRLKDSFQILLDELYDALEVNGKAIGSDQLEYQEMLQKSFNKMLVRLKDYFGNHEFLTTNLAAATDTRIQTSR